jgi:hypothetical protein
MKPEIVTWRKRTTHIARVLSPKGIYPSENTCFDEGIYIAGEDLCFSIVENRKPYPEDELYSELQWLNVSEIRTYGALMLAVDRQLGYSAFYPHPISLHLNCERPTDPIMWALKVIKPMLLDHLNQPDVQRPGFPSVDVNPYRHTTDIPLPTIAGGPPYDLRKGVVDQDLAQQLFSAMDPADILIMRGVATYIKAAMLHFHYQFFEEALNTLYISLEASFRIVLAILKETGNPNPTAVDAASYIHDALHDINRVGKYFEEDYERRIISLHPESRFGNYPYPPMTAEDYYDLFAELQEVYQYVLTGFVHPWRLKRAGLL